MIPSRWRATWRLAGRDLRRSPAMSLLVVALVGLPVVALSAGAVVYRTHELTPLERYERANGAADVELSWAGGGRLVQPGDGPLVYESAPPAIGAPAGGRAPGLGASRRLLGPGATVVERATAQWELAGAGGVDLVGVDYAAGPGRGLARQLSGQPPRSPSQVDVTPALARRAHLHVGSRLDAGGLTVVGTAADPSSAGALDVFATASTVLRLAGAEAAVDYLASTPAPVTWAGVLALGAHGYAAESRYVAVHPTAASRAAAGHPGTGVTVDQVAAGLVVGLALVEVVLLAGPALAVTARRRRHTLALVAAAGGRPGDLRNTVLASGLALGVGAGVVGAALGVGAAAAVLPVLGPHLSTRSGPFRVPWAELGGLAALAALTALGAAVLPARGAAGTDVVSVLAGRAARRPVRRGIPVAAMVTAAAGVVVTLAGAQRGATAVVVAGVAVLELALVAATPTLLRLAAAGGRWLPLAPRLALRDAGRNRTAATPATAAVMAAVIGCVAVVVGVATQSARDRGAYEPAGPYASVTVDPDPGTAGAVAAAIRADLPARVVTVVDALGRGDDLSQVRPVAPGGGVHTSRVTGESVGNGAVVVAPAGLTAVTGVVDPQAEAALAAGRAVLADAWAVRDGHATLALTTYHGAGARPRQRRVTVAAVAMTRGFAPAFAILPPSLADRLGATSVAEVVAGDRRLPTAGQRRALAADLARIAAAHGAAGGPMPTGVETGYHDPLERRMLLLLVSASVLAVLAASVATGLASAERADDLRTLDAVGAGPATRRVLSAARAGVVAGLGTALGGAAGFVPVAAYIVMGNRGQTRVASASVGGVRLAPIDLALHLVVPWGELALVVAGIPLVAAGLAGACSRSRLAAAPSRH